MEKIHAYQRADAENLYSLDDLVIKENGEITLLVEEYNSIYWTYEGSSLVSHDVYARELIIVNFNTKGKTLWYTKIPKCTVSFWPDLNNGNYIAIINNNNVYIIFHDFKKMQLVLKDMRLRMVTYL